MFVMVIVFVVCRTDDCRMQLKPFGLNIISKVVPEFQKNPKCDPKQGCNNGKKRGNRSRDVTCTHKQVLTVIFLLHAYSCEQIQILIWLFSFVAACSQAFNTTIYPDLPVWIYHMLIHSHRCSVHFNKWCIGATWPKEV